MEFKLKDKVVFITGSGKGIGKEIAKKFLLEGAYVVINDVNPNSLEEAKKELVMYSDRVMGLLGNASLEDDAIKMFSEIRELYQHLDVLVNNAAILIDKPMIEMSLDEWKRIFSNNLDSIFLTAREAVKIMLPERKPVIINAGSYGAIVPAMGYSAYNASKAAIVNLTRTMAGELSTKGIRVTGYIPGVTKTDIIKEMLQFESNRLTAQISLDRLAETSDIANTVVFLASEAASYVHGSMMEVSGGKLCVQNPRRYDNG